MYLRQRFVQCSDDDLFCAMCDCNVVQFAMLCINKMCSQAMHTEQSFVQCLDDEMLCAMCNVVQNEVDTQKSCSIQQSFAMYLHCIESGQLIQQSFAQCSDDEMLCAALRLAPWPQMRRRERDDHLHRAIH